METISANDMDRYIFDKAYLLVDVRKPAEYRRQHIRGAVCIPYEYLQERVRGFGKAVPILYCERGGLSMQAARELEERGYRAISVVGGIQAYKGNYLESYGRTPRRTL
ncbi:MAG: rhodanese-like domain-containing protein [Eubacteriales bacterium]|nr:rhodanese-like domain-containing protein [Eubacteriales bacterium]